MATDITNELAVQSYCYRGFKDNKGVITEMKKSGLTAIELCAVHVDFTDLQGAKDIVRLYQDSGIKVVSTGVSRMGNDQAAERKVLELAKYIGGKVIGVMVDVNTTPDCYRLAEKLGDEYDVNMALHNHGGHHWHGSAQILQYIFDNTSPRIGLCLDTAWAMHAHNDPLQMAEDFADRLYALHIKDFIFDRAGKHQDVVVGTGNLDMPALFNILKKNNFQGPAILEYEGDVDDPAPALTECVNEIKKAWAATS